MVSLRNLPRQYIHAGFARSRGSVNEQRETYGFPP